jgi:hypothetical protein
MSRTPVAPRPPCHPERRDQERFEHIFERSNPRPLALLQHGKPFHVDGPRPPQDHGLEQFLFGAEMVVNGRQIHPGIRNDAPQRSAGVAVVGKGPFGRVQNSVFRVSHSID